MLDISKSPLTLTKPPKKARERGMLLSVILKKLAVFARPYRHLVIATLILTVIGSFVAQVNAFVLRYTVDKLTEILKLPSDSLWHSGIELLTLISVVLLTKEIITAAVQFGQKFYGEKLRINLSRDLSQKVVERILTYKMAFYTSDDNDSGKLQTRIDLGVSKFHMHRIFKEAFDKNIYESIKSIRLQKASNLLLTNKYSTISNIVNLCGYSSQSSFIKTFKERFEMTPKDWRNGGYKEYSKKILQQSQRAMQSKADFSNITPMIVKMPSFESFYIRNKGYNINIKETWQKLQTWILTNNIHSYKQIALFHDNPTITPLNDCQYIGCIVVDDLEKVESDRLPNFKIAEGVYAKFDLKGKTGDVLPFIHWVYHEWLPKSEYETTTKPSYAIYKKLDFLDDSDEFDLSFYVSINF